MRPEESFLNQPIRSLQQMLRTIAEQDGDYETLIPDGIYGPATMSAVSTFQRRHGLGVTGITDQATWEAVVAQYELARIQVEEAESLQIVLNPNQVIRRGERHPHLYVIQGVLQALAEVYGSISEPSHSGILDAATADAIASFQYLAGLPMTGNLDKHTWKQLALHYPLAVNLGVSGNNL